MTFSLYRTKLIQVFIKSKFILDIMLKKFSEVFWIPGRKIVWHLPSKIDQTFPLGVLKTGILSKKKGRETTPDLKTKLQTTTMKCNLYT